jgi:hypothetical protein
MDEKADLTMLTAATGGTGTGSAAVAPYEPKINI